MHKKKINIASCFIGHLSKVASSKKGDINIGRFITPIVLMIKHDFEGRVLAVGRTLIGKLSIIYMEIIEKKKGKFQLQLPDGSTIILPATSRIH